MRILKKIFFSVFVMAVLSSCATNSNQKKFADMTCEQHDVIALSLNIFSAHAFVGDYANLEDPTPAIVQLHVIQRKAPGDFARQINGAEQDYQDNLIVAKKKSCDVTDYPISPVQEFEKRTNALVAERKKSGWIPQNEKQQSK
ncbi:hypothetical protein [Glaciimonas soli]|uniref:Lipoprotein n=1 Tax=Glaciimonas soli TaxID=2590999 RepID=A0A843YWV5_9BURK|nr:hypothetical protein [Glaciimonas soli]MQR01781.1 hypothetical protein [Glaciimonas soli]